MVIPLKRIEGKYEILDKLGEGGMGAVYKVRHRLLDALRVIKMMRPQLVEDEGLKARFLREARVAIQLHHPNIAQLYDFTIDDDGVASIVMEYIQGLTLEHVIGSSGPPSLGLSVEIAHQSLQALSYLHDKGFIHRDISPDNLMLATGPGGEAQVKLIDLGIAKTLDGGLTGYRTQSGTFLGKVRYASPEHFDSEGAAGMDARGDLYAFGLVLYELLTGRYPIQGRDSPSLIAGHLFWPPMDFAVSDPDGAIPPGLREVILQALAKKPQERFASAHDFLQALEAFRSPFQVFSEELQRIFARAAAGNPRRQAHDPGSTQDRLDLQFGLQATPSPARLMEVKKSPRSRELVERFEAKVRQGDFRGAERLLFDAEVDYAGEDFSAYYERLAEERQRDLAAKAEARRRAERIASAIAEAEERLAQGDHRQAGEVLDDTVSAYGDDTLFTELRFRIGELRREAQNAEWTALVAAARGSFAAGELAEALEKVDQLERLDPESAAARGLREEIEAEESRRQEAARLQAERELEAATRLEGAHRRFADGDLDGALENLAAAEEKVPGGGPARALRQEIEEERQRCLAEARRAALAATVAEIGALLDREDLAGAESSLAAAFSAFGKEEALLALGHRLEEDRQRAKREAKVAARLEVARRHFAAGDLEGALGELAAAEELDPASASVGKLTDLRQEVEDERRRREEEARREEERAVAVAAIDTLLEKGNVEGAAELLPGAVAALGEDPLLRYRSQRIADLRRRAAEVRREQERVAAMAAIDGCLERVELEEAARLLPAAVAMYGGTLALRERWERLESLRRRSSVTALLARAELLLEAVDLDRADRAVRQALDLEPGNREAEALLRRVRERH